MDIWTVCPLLADSLEKQSYTLISLTKNLNYTRKKASYYCLTLWEISLPTYLSVSVPVISPSLYLFLYLSLSLRLTHCFLISHSH